MIIRFFWPGNQIMLGHVGEAETVSGGDQPDSKRAGGIRMTWGRFTQLYFSLKICVHRQ
jgi:hypothetical protein